MIYQSRQKVGRLLVLSRGGVVDDKQATKRIKKENYDIHRTAPKNIQPKVIGQTDQEFPNHWTRYRPVR